MATTQNPSKLKPHDDKDWQILMVIGFVVLVFILCWHFAYNTQSCFGSQCYPGGSVNLHDPANQVPGYHPNTVPSLP